MKKAFSISLFVLGSQILRAHPGLASHTHESAFGEWAWLMIPCILIAGVGWYYFKRQSEKRLG